MARRGAWQLQKLTLNYCEFSGSSRGARAFLETLLPAFKQDNPHLSVEEKPRPGHHPYLEAEYRNGNVRTVGVKNQSEGVILRQAVFLRSAAGRSTHVKVIERQVQPYVRSAAGERVRASPSVQGGWRPGMAAQPQQL